jgi:hypothetical protein
MGMLLLCREPSELPAAAAGLDFVESSFDDLPDELSTSLRNCWLFMAADGEPAKRAAEIQHRLELGFFDQMWLVMDHLFKVATKLLWLKSR